MARCEMCESSHAGGIQHCPEHRSGETIQGKYEIGALLGCSDRQVRRVLSRCDERLQRLKERLEP